MDESSKSSTPQDKLTVFAAVDAACDDVGTNNTLIGSFSVEKEAKMLITELVYKKLEEAAHDVEAFATHAKRNNINIDDVKLLFRKNPKILERLKAMEDDEEKEKPHKPGGKRKRTENDSVGPSKED